MQAFALVLIAFVSSPVPSKDSEVSELLPRETWNQWRGADRDGRLGNYPLPQKLDEETLKENWHVSLGESYSGPIVAEDRVFVTETIDKKIERVSAIDRDTGQMIWTIDWQGSITVPFFAKRNGSWIRSTPAYGNGILFVGGMEDVLVAINGHDGTVRWKHDFPEKWGVSEPTFGFVSSPMLVGEYLYVHAGGSFSKLAADTGALVWRSMTDDGGMMGGWFASPILAEIDGQELILVQSRSDLAAIDKTSGEILWRRTIPSFRGMNILTPTVHDDKIFTSNYRGRSYLFDPVNTEEGGEPSLVWENKAAAYMSTPVIVDGHAYMHLQNERIACLDLATGKETWRSGTTFGGYWSMVYQGDTIMALDSDGDLLLLEANPREMTIIDRREVSSSSTWAHLAVADNQVFVRSLDGLTMFSW